MEHRTPMMYLFLLLALIDLTAMKRHKFVTLTSELDILDYILHFKDGEERQIRTPAPLLFDFSRRNGYRFTDTQFDEFVV